VSPSIQTITTGSTTGSSSGFYMGYKWVKDGVQSALDQHGLHFFSPNGFGVGLSRGSKTDPPVFAKLGSTVCE